MYKIHICSCSVHCEIPNDLLPELCEKESSQINQLISIKNSKEFINSMNSFPNHMHLLDGTQIKLHFAKISIIRDKQISIVGLFLRDRASALMPIFAK